MAIQIINVNGGTLNVSADAFNIYTQDNDIDKELSAMAKAIVRDRTRTTVVFKSDQKEPIFTVDKDALEDCQNNIDVEKLIVTEEGVNEVTLRLVKLCFDGDEKWTFYLPLSDMEIAADIEDPVFKEEVQSGKIILSANTTLEATLRYRLKKLDNGKIKKSYAVIRVGTVKTPEVPKQYSMFE